MRNVDCILFYHEVIIISLSFINVFNVYIFYFVRLIIFFVSSLIILHFLNKKLH